MRGRRRPGVDRDVLLVREAGSAPDLVRGQWAALEQRPKHPPHQ